MFLFLSRNFYHSGVGVENDLHVRIALSFGEVGFALDQVPPRRGIAVKCEVLVDQILLADRYSPFFQDLVNRRRR